LKPSHDRSPEKRGADLMACIPPWFPMDLQRRSKAPSAVGNSIGQAMDVIKEEWPKAAADGVTRKRWMMPRLFTGSYTLRFVAPDHRRILVGCQTIDRPRLYRPRNERSSRDAG